MQKRLEDEEFMENVEVLGRKKSKNGQINTNELLGENESKGEMSVFLGFVFMLGMFFVFNYIDQKNNVETIEILVHENQWLKKELKELNRNMKYEALEKLEGDENLPLLNADGGAK